MSTPVFVVVFILVLLVLVGALNKKIPFENFGTDGWVLEKGPDGLEYLVRPGPMQKDVAKSLSVLHTNLTKILAELNKRKETGSLPDHMLVPLQNLNKKYSHKAIREGVENQEYTSFSLDKKEIHFCIKSRDGTNLIYDDNLLLFVSIHEISHMASPTEGHDSNFRNVFKYLLQVAHEIGVYTPVDFKSSPVNYCGLVLNKS